MTTPACAGCEESGAWLIEVRLPTDVVVKLCPPCVRLVEEHDQRDPDWSNPGHKDNMVTTMPAETKTRWVPYQRPLTDFTTHDLMGARGRAPMAEFSNIERIYYNSRSIRRNTFNPLRKKVG